MNSASDLYIGLMSGTSADGVDAALVRLDKSSATPLQIELLHFLTHPLPGDLKTNLLKLNQQPKLDLLTLSKLEYQVAQVFVNATQKLLAESNTQTSDIAAIGSHGQTIYHAPQIPMSLQIGHPAFIAKQTGIATVGDLRIDDMANGGHGAPLAPAFHQALFGAESGTALVNIGGIANISYLGSKTLGFDTGPGNALMDDYCALHFDTAYDPNGEIAASAEPDEALLTMLMDEVYFQLPPPKTTGRDVFHLDWLNSKQNKAELTPETVLSTLNQLTVNTIVDGLNQLPEAPKQLLICGGGVENQTLLKRLQAAVSYPVKTSDDLDAPAHAMEAMMFAWLAQQRLLEKPIHLRHITGARQDSILGGLWLP